MARVIIFGQLMAASLVSLCLVEFVLLVTLPTRACLTTLKVETAFDAAAFLYISAVGLSGLTFLCYQWLRNRAAPKPRIVPSPRRPPPPASSGDSQVQLHGDTQRTPSPISRSVDPTLIDVANSARRGEDHVHMTTVVVTTDEDDAGVTLRGGENEETLGALHDINPRALPSNPEVTRRTHGTRKPMVALEGDDPLPEGDDWQIDEASGLLWSEEKQLFFDRGSGQFYDPEVEQWYNTSTNTWYQLEES